MGAGEKGQNFGNFLRKQGLAPEKPNNGNRETVEDRQRRIRADAERIMQADKRRRTAK